MRDRFSRTVTKAAPEQLELFGESGVLISDVEDWVLAISPNHFGSRRVFDTYVKNYDVINKIKREKKNGGFWKIQQLAWIKRCEYSRDAWDLPNRAQVH